MPRGFLPFLTNTRTGQHHGAEVLIAARVQRCRNVGKPESINWKNLLTALDKDGYTGRITLETGMTGKAGIDFARDSLDQLVHIVREVS